MHNSLAIKNLSIALEAVARVGGAWSTIDIFEGIQKLLKEEIKIATQENAKPIEFAPQTNPDDNIPF